ncbi:MAG: D-alanyl-D-alanine carboxypeptidase family protein [Spirochaetaceae bacterium]|nr:MAG: D-alanyl-D-alanine carboxypeptidase family protein [Spirochaetaceae bacterium]
MRCDTPSGRPGFSAVTAGFRSICSVRRIAGVAGAIGLAVIPAVLTGCTRPAVEPPPVVETPPALHPGYQLTRAELLAITGSQPETVRSAVSTNPHGFLELLLPVLDLPHDLLILVDKQNPLPSDWHPEDLVSLAEFQGRIRYAAADRTVRQVMVDNLLLMADAARSDGVNLVVQSAFRSYAFQATLFANYAARHGEDAANRFSARAGQSQHQLGTAIDFAPIGHQFTGTRDDLWLREHAWRFGFSLSYPQGYEEITGYIFEPWHYRYLGRETTLLEREFFGGIQQYLLEFLHQYGDHVRSLRTPTAQE